MIKRLFTFGCFLTGFVFFLILQSRFVGNVYSAPPISSPQPTATPPVSAPPPITSFKITGRVKMLKLRFFAPPPATVEVVAKDESNTTVSSFTDAHGNYSLPAHTGKYKVSVSPVSGFRFTPPEKLVVVKNRDVHHVDFTGHPVLKLPF